MILKLKWSLENRKFFFTEYLKHFTENNRELFENVKFFKKRENVFQKPRPAIYETNISYSFKIWITNYYASFVLL